MDFVKKEEQQIESEVGKERDQVDKATGGYFTSLLHGTWQTYAEVFAGFEGFGLLAEVVGSFAAVFALWYLNLTVNRALDTVEAPIAGIVGKDKLQWFGDITYLSKVESIARTADTYVFGGFDWVNNNVYHKFM